MASAAAGGAAGDANYQKRGQRTRETFLRTIPPNCHFGADPLWRR